MINNFLLVGPNHEKIVVCLAYTNKVIESFNSTKIAKLDNIDLNLCTHLYAVHSGFSPDRGMNVIKVRLKSNSFSICILHFFTSSS